MIKEKDCNDLAEKTFYTIEDFNKCFFPDSYQDEQEEDPYIAGVNLAKRSLREINKNLFSKYN